MNVYSLPKLEEIATLVKKIKELETQLSFLRKELSILEGKEEAKRQQKAAKKNRVNIEQSES